MKHIKTFENFKNELKGNIKSPSESLNEDCRDWQKEQLDRELNFLKQGVDDTEDIEPDEIVNIVKAWIEDHTGIETVILKHYPENPDIEDFITNWVCTKVGVDEGVVNEGNVKAIVSQHQAISLDLDHLCAQAQIIRGDLRQIMPQKDMDKYDKMLKKLRVAILDFSTVFDNK